MDLNLSAGTSIPISVVFPREREVDLNMDFKILTHCGVESSLVRGKWI